jgi:hypothetical protein
MEILDYSGGFGWGRTRLWLGHDRKEEDATDSGVPPVSDSVVRDTRPLLRSGPAHAGRNRGNELGSSAQPRKRERREQAGSVRLGRASRPPGRR